MASLTTMLKAKRAARLSKAGRKRKVKQGLRSTPSAKELFAELDEPEKKNG